jgi:hypothetical protein
VNGETKFWIELPGDKYGHVGKLPRAVVEARWYDRASDFSPSKNPGRPYLVCAAPAEIAQKWPGWYADDKGGWAEVEGPARLLTYEEWEALVAQVQARGAR